MQEDGAEDESDDDDGDEQQKDEVKDYFFHLLFYTGYWNIIRLQRSEYAKRPAIQRAGQISVQQIRV